MHYEFNHKRYSGLFKLSEFACRGYADAINAAGERLDEIKPGWFDLVNLSRLDLNSSTRCVLGQVFREEANLSGYKLSGFTYATMRHNWGAGIIAFAGTRTVERMWVDYIRFRRAEAKQAKVVYADFSAPIREAQPSKSEVALVA